MAKRKEESERKTMEHKDKPKKASGRKVKSAKISETTDVKKSDRKSQIKGGKINEGKCCRCAFRDRDRICGNSKSPNHGKHVPRKSGCENFKYE